MSRLYVAQASVVLALRTPPLQVGACVECFFFGVSLFLFVCCFVLCLGPAERPENLQKSLEFRSLQFPGERRRAHRGLRPCAALLELQLITACRVHKQLAALRSVECPWGKLQGEMRLIQTSEF